MDNDPQQSFHVVSECMLGDMSLLFVCDRESDPISPGPIGLYIVPTSARSRIAAFRPVLDAPSVTALPSSWLPLPADTIESMVQVHEASLSYTGGFSQGRSLMGSPMAQSFRWLSQTRTLSPEGKGAIETTLRSPHGLTVIQKISHDTGSRSLVFHTVLHNSGTKVRNVELAASVALGGITPFAPDDATGGLSLHRFRTTWSAEARPESLSFESLHLERSWSGHGVNCERFGQVGSMPANGFMPRAAIEDKSAGITWALQLAHGASWQMEVWRKGDRSLFSAGLADYEFGHWRKTLHPGESLTCPEAHVTVCAGSPELAWNRLNDAQRSPLAEQPAEESNYPIIFNEWCTSWGNPSHNNILELADRLEGSKVRYLVIDYGWAERTPGSILDENGDWMLSSERFPMGLAATAQAVRQRGLIPGLWFEFEVVNSGSKAFSEVTHQLHRHNQPLQVGTRRFWDFRDPWVHSYLTERVINLLRDADIGYLKIDYNDSLGIGCDGAESLGEGLRQHIAGVQSFIKRIRTELPNLVIENCSSGGHRIEPSFLALTAMSSSTDAHETPEIPLIAANLLHTLSPRQNQIWAVLRPEDSRQRLEYSLAATFLGRVCLSGQIHQLSTEQMRTMHHAVEFYENRVVPYLKHGRFRIHRKVNDSYRHLRGWQMVEWEIPGSDQKLLVWHTFADPDRGWKDLLAKFTTPPTATWGEDPFHMAADKPADWMGGAIIMNG